ncbi:MAG: leucine-rich repeat domain-containing protein, partial [Clostridia bacterium]|nr:leucine-rich repeat domain-containing protein [Clostridia bacterium]
MKKVLALVLALALLMSGTALAFTEKDKYIDVSNQGLTSLDVSRNTALNYLNCYNNQLTTLDVSMNTALTRLFCGKNQLTSLDVSKNTALKYLWCNSNQLTCLDVSKNTALIDLNCYNNPEGFYLIVMPSSYAMKYAVENGIPYIFPGEPAPTPEKPAIDPSLTGF